MTPCPRGCLIRPRVEERAAHRQESANETYAQHRNAVVGGVADRDRAGTVVQFQLLWTGHRHGHPRHCIRNSDRRGAIALTALPIPLRNMSYAEITFKDKNPIKRWIHRQRLLSAIKLCRRLSQPIGAICDFGAGNGELCKLAAASYPEARIICYEPAPSLLAEARANLSNVSNVELCQDIGTVSPGTLDVVFCLEVFEHLPPEETTDALRTIFGLLKPEGTAVVGVPVEVGFPALYK